MVIIRRSLPDRPDYKAACRQTVTLYNVYEKEDKTKGYHKTVFVNSAFLEAQRLWREQVTGTTANTNLLLIIPINASGYEYVDAIKFAALPDKTGYWTIKNSDKAYPGVGPDILTLAEWSKFLPTAHPGLVIIGQVDPKKTLDGVLVHIEAGG